MILRKLYHLIKGHQNPWRSEHEIKEIQIESLKKIVAHAYATVPYYRNLFQKANILPGDITHLDDLSNIPITKKKDFVAFDTRERLSSACRPELLNRHATGGTTGQMIHVYCEDILEDLRASSLFRMYFSNGYRFTDKIGNLQFYPVQSKALSKIGLLRRFAVPFVMPMKSQLEMLQLEKAQVLEGYPSRLSLLAKELLRQNIQNIKPRLILANSENLTREMRKDVRRAFGIEPINVYESIEFGTIAWECPMHEGLHMESDRLIVEILADGKMAGENEPGDIIITDLHNMAMPLIRYKTDDIGIRTDNLCSCGRKFPLIKELIGRASEKLLLSDGSEIFVTTQLSAIIEESEGIREYQAIQNSIGELDLLVEADGKFNSSEEMELKNKLIQSFHLDNVMVSHVQNIERTNVGKRNCFISKVS